MKLVSKGKVVGSYYWYYTLGYDGKTIEDEGRPSICWYNPKTGMMQLIGDDYDVVFSEDRYRILNKVISYTSSLPMYSITK